MTRESHRFMTALQVLLLDTALYCTETTSVTLRLFGKTLNQSNWSRCAIHVALNGICTGYKTLSKIKYSSLHSVLPESSRFPFDHLHFLQIVLTTVALKVKTHNISQKHDITEITVLQKTKTFQKTQKQTKTFQKTQHFTKHISCSYSAVSMHEF